MYMKQPWIVYLGMGDHVNVISPKEGWENTHDTFKVGRDTAGCGLRYCLRWYGRCSITIFIKGLGMGDKRESGSGHLIRYRGGGEDSITWADKVA